MIRPNQSCTCIALPLIDKALNGGSKITTWKSFFLCLPSWDNRNGQQVLVHSLVQLQNHIHLEITRLMTSEHNQLSLNARKTLSQSYTAYLLDGVLLVGPGSVALLPEELASAEEGLRMLELPALVGA